MAFNPLDEYSMDEIEEFVFDSIAPAHCKACGEYAGEFEPDARNIDCEACGETGTVESVIESLFF